MLDYSKCSEIFISKEEIAKRVSELADEINKEYEGQEIFVIGVLKGSFEFLADLYRQIKVPARLDFIVAKSYSGTESTGEVEIIKDVSTSIEGLNVILVEDIVDSGITLSKVIPIFKSRNPKSLKLCAFLNKPDRRVVKELVIDYKGYDIPDKFVVGYGLDFDENFRNFPEIRIYNP